MFMVELMLMFMVGCAFAPGDTSNFPAPDEPDGPKVATVGQKVTFETEGTDPADVHEYQWSFGDGSELTDWDDGDEEIKYRYSSPGTYKVKVREQCPLKIFQSGWSDEHKITIQKAKKKTIIQVIMSMFQ